MCEEGRKWNSPGLHHINTKSVKCNLNMRTKWYAFILGMSIIQTVQKMDVN
jgi:hypothetical protein